MFFGDIFIIWSIAYWILYIREANVISLKIVSIQYPWLSKWFFRKYFAYFTLYLSHIIAVRNFRKIYSLFWKFSNKFYLKFPMSSFCSRTSNVPFFSTKCLTLKWFRRMEFYLRFWVLFWIMNLCDFMIFNGWFIFSY